MRYGFIGEDNKVYLTRCPACKLENYAPMVASGTCAWCGYKAKEEDVNSN